MKKISLSFISPVLLVSLCLMPLVASAATLTSSQVSAIIGLLEAFGVNASTIQIVYADLVPSVASVQSAPATQSTTMSTSIDYSIYVPVSLHVFGADVGAYIGKNISIVGMVNSFLPKGGSGGTTNYIEITDPYDSSVPQLALEIDDPTTYSSAVASLQDKSNPILQFVRGYGTAVASQRFSMTNMFGTQTTLVPTINVTRIDKCQHGSMQTTVLTGSTIDDNFSCTAWTTIAGQ
jgi:hypothetical protein